MKAQFVYVTQCTRKKGTLSDKNYSKINVKSVKQTKRNNKNRKVGENR